MAEVEQLHVAAEGGTEPAVVLSMHSPGTAKTSDVRVQISEFRAHNFEILVDARWWGNSDL